jgi:hypothetical protein
MLKHKSLTCNMRERGKREGSLEFGRQQKRAVYLNWKPEDFGHGIQIKRSVQMREWLAKTVQILLPNLTETRARSISSRIKFGSFGWIELATRTT